MGWVQLELERGNSIKLYVTVYDQMQVQNPSWFFRAAFAIL